MYEEGLYQMYFTARDSGGLTVSTRIYFRVIGKTWFNKQPILLSSGVLKALKSCCLHDTRITDINCDFVVLRITYRM